MAWPSQSYLAWSVLCYKLTWIYDASTPKINEKQTKNKNFSFTSRKGWSNAHFPSTYLSPFPFMHFLGIPPRTPLPSTPLPSLDFLGTSLVVQSWGKKCPVQPSSLPFPQVYIATGTPGKLHTRFPMHYTYTVVSLLFQAVLLLFWLYLMYSKLLPLMISYFCVTSSSVSSSSFSSSF